MGILTLLFALGETISETIHEKAEQRRAIEEKRRYENIDFYNIESVTFDGTETAYRIETEEEFDPVMTDFLTRQDGWQHYETKTVEYEVPNGLNYCFTIKYKNGETIYRAFHESSYLTKRLLEYCDDENDADDFLNEIYDFNRKAGSSEKLKSIKTARSYLLNCSGFSYSRLIRQLEKIEEFTPEQAKYGVDNSGAIWNEQAVKSAKSYLECFNYSRQQLIDQLKNQEKFTYEQAKYAANALGFRVIQPKNKPKQAKEHIAVTPNERFAIIDFETTGVNYNFRNAPMDEILSVAIIDQDEKVLLNTYCDTMHKKSWYAAQRVNGISPSDVKGYPTFLEIMPKVIEILSSFDYVIAYNIPFEKSFLENYTRLYTPTDFSVQNINWGEDPMEMFMDYMNSNNFLKLTAAAEHFGYKYKAHDALEDVKATLFVYKALREK